MEKHRMQHPLYGVYQGLTAEQYWRAFVHRIFNSLGHDMDYKAVDKAADILIHDFDTDPTMWEILPHAESVLQNIRTNGTKLGVISNFDERLKDTLHKQRLARYFDFVVTCFDAMAEKPDARIFEHALGIAGVKAKDTVHVGDDPERDFRAARRVGMKAILLNANNRLSEEEMREVPPQLIVTDLSDIPELIKAL